MINKKKTFTFDLCIIMAQSKLHIQDGTSAVKIHQKPNENLLLLLEKFFTLG